MRAGENPFAPGRLERLLGYDPALAGTTWEALESRWHDLGRRAAVTGHRGAGKSALLRAWAQRCDSPVVLHFNEQRRRLDEADRQQIATGAGRVWIIDGADYLALRDRPALHRAAKAAAGILVSRYRARGWPELLRLKSTPQLAGALLERISASHAGQFRFDLDARFRRCDGNLREFWLACYDDLAGRKVL
ncbi:hypothetical protein OKA04_10115 [Luteolibacter flavescens]|uniref:ATP-binding protein n=1 Tax=Luteolibacter flavescens TaxID=1859460 RepID=A0ABT3FNN8_9BACT|nr:hypothetical protein [Luteolibacter flavescens]MCW1885082.1 hypothetical protein [Luteolibacter flavescens]